MNRYTFTMGKDPNDGMTTEQWQRMHAAAPEMLEELRWWAEQVPQEGVIADSFKQRSLRARALLATIDTPHPTRETP